ncbi:unnamed protein product [Owenia fusiformis]|uniref:Uncharacterized protein n=1 Tax=Owenia fusiformis TaxID=6347 RepID=A0A8J1TAX4_OWEFU|nr:unnamed protein product [Owenia fusiformis]
MGTGQYMCEWALCQRFFETPAGVLNHISKLHLSAIVNDGTCMWEGCDGLRRKKWSLYTHIQDRHCTEHALKAAALRRQQLQNVPGGGGLIPQGVNAGPTPPAPVYPHDAAIQAIRRFSIKPPYPELMEPKEGPVTKHIRLTSSLILRNLARYSAVGRTCIKRHEGQLAYVALSPVESSTAISNCLWELHQHH